MSPSRSAKAAKSLAVTSARAVDPDQRLVEKPLSNLGLLDAHHRLECEAEAALLERCDKLGRQRRIRPALCWAVPGSGYRPRSARGPSAARGGALRVHAPWPPRVCARAATRCRRSRWSPQPNRARLPGSRRGPRVLVVSAAVRHVVFGAVHQDQLEHPAGETADRVRTPDFGADAFRDRGKYLVADVEAVDLVDGVEAVYGATTKARDQPSAPGRPCRELRRDARG